MNLLPVAHRELQLLASRPRAYLGRTLTALAVILISLAMLYAGFGGFLSAATAGRNLFVILACVAAAYVLLDGVLLTADCLSEEKREGTLGLLFLTDLRGYDIVAGKLISRGANAAYCMLGALPALGIALFLGGVSGTEFLHMTVALLNGLFFSASFGMLVSAASRQERQAFGVAVLGVLSIAVLIPLLGWGISLYQNSPTIHPWFLLASPAGGFLHTLMQGVAGPGMGFGFVESLAVSHALGWCFLLSASLILPRSWREPDSGGTARKAFGNAKQRPARRRVDDDSLAWAGDRRGDRGLGFWPAMVVFALACGLGLILNRGQWLAWHIYAVAVCVLHLGLVYAFALQACRGPGQDQRSGVLELLLTTPRGDDIYLNGRMLSLKRRTFGPVLFVLAADFGLMVAGCWQSGPLDWEWLGWIGAFVFLGLKLLLDLYTVSWVGLWQGLKSGSTGRAVRRTVFYVFVIRWLLLLGLLAALGMVTDGRLFQSAIGGVTAAVAYLAFVLMTSLNFCGAALSDLEDNLRVLALQRGVASEPRVKKVPRRRA